MRATFRALLLAAGALLFVVACATQSLNTQLKAGYDTVTGYQAFVAQALDRDRMTVEQGDRALANARKAKATLDAARLALAGCKPEAPCTEYTSIMQQLQPALLELERELRARELQGTAK